MTTLAWRRNSRIANESANCFGTQRRESDLNTRALADAALPTRSLGRAREIPPTVRRRVELRSLAALGFKPSAVTNLLVSPHTVGACFDESPSRYSRDAGRCILLSFCPSLSGRVSSPAPSHGRAEWRSPRSVKVRAFVGNADSHTSNRVDGRCLTEWNVAERFLVAVRADILWHHAVSRSRTGNPSPGLA